MSNNDSFKILLHFWLAKNLWATSIIFIIIIIIIIIITIIIIILQYKTL